MSCRKGCRQKKCYRVGMNATRVIELATKTQERRRIVQVRKMEQNALQQGFHSEYTLVNHLNHFFKYYWHGIQTKIYSQ